VAFHKRFVESYGKRRRRRWWLHREEMQKDVQTENDEAESK
jgi:hypothetical protein